MLNLLLLAGKVLFLLVLYLFVLMVIRSAVRELRAASAAHGGGGRALPIMPPGGRGAGGHDPLHEGHWALTVLESPALDAGRSLALPPAAAVTVGRAGDNDLALDDTFVSSHHARLNVTPEGLLLEDLGSTNGSYVNGEETGRAWLRPGDELAIGDSVFLVEAH